MNPILVITAAAALIFAAAALQIRTRRDRQGAWFTSAAFGKAVRNGKRYPFKMPPMQNTEFSVAPARMTNEPDAYINASKATTWIYREGNDISHVVLAGHANSTICGQFTSRLMNAYHDLDVSDDTLIVPGAGLLCGKSGAARFRLAQPIPPTLPAPMLPLFQQIWNSQHVPPLPLHKMQQDFAQISTDSGLGKSCVVQDETYTHLVNRFVNAMRQHAANKRPVLLQTSKTGSPKALYLPYFKLASDFLEPISIEIALSEFETDDFHYLVSVHRHSMLVQMSNDALRRRQIYEDWLRDDEKKYAEFGRYYQQLSPEARTAKDSRGIKISGVRDYNEATIKQAELGEETYTSVEEYYTQQLPEMIRIDKIFIQQMDMLLGTIGRAERSRALRDADVNVAVLIDSFLRGWPSFFLPDEEAKRRYGVWCDKRRKHVWQYIHKALAAQGVQMSPLLEANTVFRTTFTSPTTLRITPLHLITTESALIYLSPQVGMTYYVDAWSRRRETPAAQATDFNARSADAQRHYADAVRLLDKAPADAAAAASLLQQGIAELREALIHEPITTASALWADWWKRFARDTSTEYQQFKALAEGFAAYDNFDTERAKACLEQFNQVYPDQVADSYLILAMIDMQSQYELDELRMNYRIQRDLQRTLQRQSAALQSYIESNSYLATKANRDHAEEKRYAEVQRAKAQQEGNLIDLMNHRHNLDQLNAMIGVQLQKMWADSTPQTNPNLRRAHAIDPAHVNKVLEEKRFSLSMAAVIRFRPMQHILQAEEYLAIALKLAEIKHALSGASPIDLITLQKRTEDIPDVRYLTQQDIKQLVDFSALIMKMSAMDSIMRYNVLNKLEPLILTYLRQAFTLYREEVDKLPMFTEPLEASVSLGAKYEHQYANSLKRLLEIKVPLRNFSPTVRWEVLSPVSEPAESISFDVQTNRILGKFQSGAVIPLLAAHGLSPEERTHLAAEIAQLSTRRGGYAFSNVAHEIILNRLITPAPRVQRWNKAIDALRGELIRIIAYAGVYPTRTQEGQDMTRIAEFYKRVAEPPIQSVSCTMDDVQARFLKEIARDQPVTILNI